MLNPLLLRAPHPGDTARGLCHQLRQRPDLGEVVPSGASGGEGVVQGAWLGAGLSVRFERVREPPITAP